MTVYRGLARLCCGLASLACAAEYRVAPGDSIESRAALLKAGDTLLIQAGVHTQSVTLAGLEGTEQAPIVIRGEPGSEGAGPTATIRATGTDALLFAGGCAHVSVEGLRFENGTRAGIVVSASRHIAVRRCVVANNGRWGVQTCLCDDVRVEDCDVSGSGSQHGVYFSTTDRPTVRRCVIGDNAGCGVHFNGDKSEGGDGLITGAVVEQNVIFGSGRTGGAAINMDGVERSLVRGNLVYGNVAGGIVTFCHDAARSGTDNVFRDNTVWFRPGEGRYGLAVRDGAARIAVTGNVLVCANGPALTVNPDSRDGLMCDGNVYFSMGRPDVVALGEERMDLARWQKLTGQDARSVAADPLFADPAAADFRIPPGSPALPLRTGRRESLRMEGPWSR